MGYSGGKKEPWQRWTSQQRLTGLKSGNNNYKFTSVSLVYSHHPDLFVFFLGYQQSQCLVCETNDCKYGVGCAPKAKGVHKRRHIAGLKLSALFSVCFYIYPEGNFLAAGMLQILQKKRLNMIFYSFIVPHVALIGKGLYTRENIRENI